MRLAEELGRVRPDIPILVVEGRGTEADLAARGVDLRGPGNVAVMSRPDHPSGPLGVSRLVLAPLLDPWVGGALAEPANLGIPVVASDHPALRSILGRRAAFAPVPAWMTPCSRRIPTSCEVRPWADAVIRCWDEPGPAPPEGTRHPRPRPTWAQGGPGAASALAALPTSKGPRLIDAAARREGWAVLVPFMNTIEPECEAGLHALEQAGVRVVRCRGSSAIDHARSTLASEALRRGSRSVLFIDSDLAFDPSDALRLFARPEPVVAGIYTKKKAPALSSSFPPEISSVVFGAASPGCYPLDYAAAGFLRIRADVLRLMVERLGLPLCNTHVSEGFWPFFLPIILPREDGSHHYLAEDWAFSYRLAQIGITPLADTTIRLYHLGMHGYTWEDTMRTGGRYESFIFDIAGGGDRSR